MKRGDLVKLVLPAAAAALVPGVPVVWDLDEWRSDPARWPRTSFPAGTLAVFLSPADDENTPVRFDTRILIEGRVGWVWSKYLEAV